MEGGGASGEMAAWGQGAAARRGGGGAKRGRGGEMVLPASASRICRARASGAKDRHSKVVTAKGVRDRRVRLAVPTAIQFYDLQDRLGLDQPSKAVQWLLDAAAHAIDRLPPLDPAAFAPFPGQATKGGGGGSSASETTTTSKGSDLSLSTSRVVRRRGSSSSSRDKQKQKRAVTVAASPAQAASFTELLNGDAIAAATAEHIQSWHRQQQQQQPVSAGFAHPGQKAYAGLRFGNAPPLGMVPVRPFDFPNSAGEITPFSFVQDVLAAASSPAPAPAPAPAGNYSLDFSMSSGFVGGGNSSRGTLQSNSQSQYFPNQLHELDGPSPPFLYDPTAPLQLWNGFRMEEKSQN